MSYVLSPNGKIINKQDGKEYDAGDVTKEVLESNKDFFESKMAGDTPFARPSAVILPAGIVGLTNTAIGSSANEYGIIEKEKPVIEEDTLFPNKTNANGENNLLVNSSFGSSGPVSYYSQYNSHLNKSNEFLGSSFKNNIYAEELEMLAGIDFNTLGLSFNLRNIDFSYFFFAVDFILESIVYITTAWYFLSTKDTFPVTPIRDYFHKLLNLNTKKYNEVNSLIEDLEINHLIKYFITGLEEFMLTDAKVPGLIEESETNKIESFANDGTVTFFISHFKKILLYFSKVGRNRFFLLIRKIQKESYWHSEILYKAKEDTAENFVDKFFVEFSHYYFKFLFERINIGYIVTQSGTFKYITATKTNNRNNSKQFVDLFRDKNLKLHTMTADQSLNKRNLLLGVYDNKTKRFKNEKVAAVQKELEEGYMPFYFHDLRTNEILSFNAHLNNISDSFTPNYNETKGYGRIDSVRHYIDTTRSISLGFSLVAQSEEEFTHIWYQVEKLVAMVYPQWSQGIPANTGKFKGNKSFRFPFTQMPTASPMIRLKVGDVFKSNYSKQAIKRLHGNTKDVSYNVETIELNKKENKEIIFSKDNFKDFFIVEKDNYLKLDSSSSVFKNILAGRDKIKLPMTTTFIELKSTLLSTFLTKETQYFVEITNIVFNEKDTTSFKNDSISKEDNENLNRVFYKYVRDIKVLPALAGAGEIYMWEHYLNLDNERSAFKKDSKLFASYENVFLEIKKKIKLYKMTVTLNDFKVSTAYFFTLKEYDTISEYKRRNIKETTTIEDNVIDSGNGKNNPYTAAFESAQGLGLAGFITSLGVEGMNESTWNVFESGANAPHSVKISIGFAPVHDIPPGLDHNGQIRAPIYNVGRKSHMYFGNRSIDREGKYKE